MRPLGIMPHDCRKYTAYFGDNVTDRTRFEQLGSGMDAIFRACSERGRKGRTRRVLVILSIECRIAHDCNLDAAEILNREAQGQP